MRVRGILLPACFLITAHAVWGQVREEPMKDLKHRSADGSQVLTINRQGSMTLRSGDGPAAWTATLNPDEVERAQFWVHDRGWVVTAAGNDLVTIHEPKRGEKVLSLSMLEQFAKHGWSRHVHAVTDRPPLWETHALWAFREVQGSPCFVVRPWWGERIIVDLRQQKLIDDADAVREEIVAQETEWVVRTLRDAAALPCPDDRTPGDSWPIVYRARMAAHLAGVLKVREATDSLKALETWNYTDKSVGSSNDAADASGLNPARYRVNTLRQAVQLSLRRLGETPAEPAPVTLERIHPDRTGEARLEQVAFARPALPQAAALKSLRPGMSVQQVGELLGGPDGIVDSAWEYDIQEGGTRTIRVTWESGRVAAMQRVAPRWRTDTKRDEEFLY